jgi:HEAT repeat protein
VRPFGVRLVLERHRTESIDKWCSPLNRFCALIKIEMILRPNASRAPSFRERGQGTVPIWLAVFLIAAVGAAFLIYLASARKTVSDKPGISAKAANPEARQKFPITMLSRKATVDPKAAAELLKATDPATPTGKLIFQLLNESESLKVRRTAAFTLAKMGSDEAFKALNAGLSSTNSMTKAAIAESLGECPHLQAPALLAQLLNDDDETVARGAVRGVAARGDVAAAEVLSELLFDPDRSDDMRAEAALALGDVQQPQALAALARAVNEIQDESIVEQIWEGLGNRPFSETEDLFRSYLNSPNLSSEDKVMALEALGNTEGNVAPLFLEFANDPDEEVRAAAAWGLVSAELPAQLDGQMMQWLENESSPEVRDRLYEALSSQANPDPATALALAQKETDPAARLSVLGLAAVACDSPSPAPELLAYFNQTAVPELQQAAVSSSNLGDRLNSVMALGRAGTPEALLALEEIIRNSRDSSTVEAAQTALAHRRQ